MRLDLEGSGSGQTEVISRNNTTNFTHDTPMKYKCTALPLVQSARYIYTSAIRYEQEHKIKEIQAYITVTDGSSYD
jgi:hypothetical protein